METSKATPRISFRRFEEGTILYIEGTGETMSIKDWGLARQITDAVNSYDREKSAMRALENLTPSGSEYVGDIARCVEFIRQRQASQHQHIISLTKRIRASSERDRSMEVLLGMIDTYHKRILKTPIDIDSYPTAADIFAKNSELLLLLEGK